MTNKNEYSIYKIYRLLHVIPTIVLGIIMIIKGRTVGEEAIDIKLSLSGLKIFLLLVLQVITIELTTPLYVISKKISFNRNVKCVFTNKIHLFFLAIIIIQIWGTLLTGNMVDVVAGGIKETWNRSIFTTILNAIKISAVFPLYYVIARDDKPKKIYWINILLYVFWQIICGWSSIFLMVGILELYLRFRDKQNNFFRWFAVTSTTLIFGFGTFLYKIVWPIKNQIRYGFSFDTPTFMESLEKLMSRFTNFPISLIALENNHKIAELYKTQGMWNAEIMVMFNTLLPRFIMPNKNFRPLANIVKQSIYSDIEIGTGTGYNFFIKEINLLYSNFACFILWNIILILLICSTVWILKAFDHGDNKTNILLYMLCFKIMNGGDFEAVFGYGYLGLIYMLPLMYITGVVKIIK